MNSLTQALDMALQLLISADPVLISVVVRSLAVSLSACALACAIGLPLGAWLGVARAMAEIRVLAPMARGRWLATG